MVMEPTGEWIFMSLTKLKFFFHARFVVMTEEEAGTVIEAAESVEVQ